MVQIHPPPTFLYEDNMNMFYEAFKAFMVVFFPFIAIWLYYALTGNKITF